MSPPRDPFDPDHPPPHWVDEEGNFSGWLTEAEIAAHNTAYAEAIADSMTDDEASHHAIDLAELLAGGDATDDEIEF